MNTKQISALEKLINVGLKLRREMRASRNEVRAQARELRSQETHALKKERASKSK